MPYGDQLNDLQIRLMLFGRPKLKKTWWAMNAAAAGFNVLLLDGDKGAGIIQQVNHNIRRRLRIIECADKLNVPVFADFITRFLAGHTIRWDDTDNRVIPTIQVPNPTHAHFIIDATKLTLNDVVVLDSWSSLVVSFVWQYHMENGIDLNKEPKDKWGNFRYSDRMLNWILSAIKAIPCHVIVIAHEMTNEETEPKHNQEGKIERVLTGEINIQADSSSRNHGGKLPKHFSDILYFHKKGTHIYVDTRAIEGRDGGSRLIYDDREWDKLQFTDFVKASGLEFQQDAPMPGCVYFEPGMMQTALPPAKTVVLGQTKPQATPATTNGLPGLTIPGSTAKKAEPLAAQTVKTISLPLKEKTHG